MARFTQTPTTTNGSASAFVQLSSTWTGGSVPVMFYALAAINYCVGEYADSTAVIAGARVNIIPGSLNLMFGPVDPSKMWVRSNGASSSTLYWDTIS